jgi:excisionase family DNA binding protein
MSALGELRKMWITVKEACAQARISRASLYKAIRRGNLRVARFGSGRAIRTRLEWVNSFMEACASGGPVSREVDGRGRQE